MTCQRKNHFMRNIVTVAQRNRHLLGPLYAARFLCSNGVPLNVALRVLTRK